MTEVKIKRKRSSQINFIAKSVETLVIDRNCLAVDKKVGRGEYVVF